ncbi:hypothetical protein [Chromobacterium sp. ASV23]|uniref:hypothetical protein n=1 Tax=Chromobacterium sp. ASV23 TaxID=2795110 RepID=UPI0018ED47E9|nr:hypothetical protein [Chromobacterium sp. ASV23]
MRLNIGGMTTGDRVLNQGTDADRAKLSAYADDTVPKTTSSSSAGGNDSVPQIDPNAGTPAAVVTLSGSDGSVIEKAIVYEKPKPQASGKPPTGSVDSQNHNEFYVKDGGKFLSCAWDVASLFTFPEYKGAKALAIANDLVQRTKTIADVMSDCRDGLGVRMTNHKPPAPPVPTPKTIGGGDCIGVNASHVGTLNNAVVDGMGSLGSSSGYVECSEPTIYDGSTGGGGGGGGPNENHFVIEMD